MSLVDDNKAYVPSAHAGDEVFAGETFGCEVEELEAPLTQSLIGIVGFGAGHAGAEISGRYAAFAKVVDLVLHQGDQGRYHDSEALEGHSRYLECQRLATAGGKKADSVVAGENALYYFKLKRTKAVVAPVTVQNVVEVVFIRPFFGVEGGKSLVEVAFVGKIVVAVRFHEGLFEVGANLFYQKLYAGGGVLMLILFDGITDIERLAGVDMVEIGSHVEGNTIDYTAGGVIDELKLDVLEIAAYEFARAEILDAPSAECGLAVAGAERIEEPESRNKFRSDIGEREERVDVDLRGKLLGKYVGGNVFLEAPCEFGNILFFHRQADRIGVSAEILEQIAGGFDGLIDVESLHGARRTCREAVRERKDNRRLVVKLGEARCHDADNALVPVLIVDDNRFFGRVGLAAGVENGVGFLGNPFVEFFAVFVVLVDFEALACRFLGVAGHKQFYRLASALHAARCIDARPDLEHHIADAYFLAAETACANYGPKSEIGISVEPFEAHVGHGAVFVDHGHDVGGNADSNKIEHALEFGGGNAVADREGLHEFVAYAAARQVGARIGRIFELWVENGYSRRKLVVGDVVVADNEIDATLGCVADLVDGFDAAVENYDQFHTLLGHIIDAFARNAVAFVVACGDIEIELGVEILKIAVYERYGSGAVDIVVAVDHDFFFRTHSPVEAFDGFVHIVHEERIVKVAEGWVKELIGCCYGGDATLYKEVCYGRTIGKAPGKFGAESLFFRRHRWVIPFASHNVRLIFCKITKKRHIINVAQCQKTL